MAFVFALRSHGVTNPDVLKAMEATPRAEFIEGVFRERAFEDTPLPIACGQTISQPGRRRSDDPGARGDRSAARCSRSARARATRRRSCRGSPGASTRSSGTGAWRAPRGRCSSGSELVNITVVIGDGSLGLPEQAPFDRIILTAAAEDPPKPLLDQLRPGGIMVLPVGQSNAVQTLIKIVEDRERPRLHRPRAGALRAARRRRRPGSVGLGRVRQDNGFQHGRVVSRPASAAPPWPGRPASRSAPAPAGRSAAPRRAPSRTPRPTRAG